MTRVTDEQFVREQWPQHADYCGTPHQPVRIFTGPDGVLSFGRWDQAAEYTRTRLAEIRDVEEEIVLLRSMIILLSSEPGDETAPVYQRTISRLEAALADLKRGLK